MAKAAPLRLWKESILPEWLDYNGHLNEAYYVLIFSHATDAFMSHIGLEPDAEKRKENSLYTLETHVCYLNECSGGDEVTVATRLLGMDAKRYHCFHEMYLSGSDKLLATAEMIMLHVDMSGPRSAPFPADVRARLADIRRSHESLPLPAHVNGAMGLRRR